ncbi:hypothetical protein BH11BAC3_BH11BAC3_12920 [soil metagenome]
MHLPGLTVRDSMKSLVDYYGTNKAACIACDPVEYLEEFLKTSRIPFAPFVIDNQNKLSIRDRLKIKVDDIEPMDAANMLIALVESYGDEKSARYLYDKVWRERIHSDYDADALSRFLLNHGRSYDFNFQDKKERAECAQVYISNSFFEEYYREISCKK